jgi:hypothetical protein
MTQHQGGNFRFAYATPFPISLLSARKTFTCLSCTQAQVISENSSRRASRIQNEIFPLRRRRLLILPQATHGKQTSHFNVYQKSATRARKAQPSAERETHLHRERVRQEFHNLLP